MPVIRMAKPMKISPIFFFFSSFEIILKRIPINASRGAKVMGLSSVRKKLSSAYARKAQKPRGKGGAHV